MPKTKTRLTAPMILALERMDRGNSLRWDEDRGWYIQGGGRIYKVHPQTIYALTRRKYIEHNFFGATITPAGRRALMESKD